MVTTSKKHWAQKNELNQEKVTQLAEELELSELFIQVCLQRGLSTTDEIKQFIEVDETWFHDPFLMHDMDKTVERIQTALENNEQITVYGDYDADGMTSTALLTETLESLGANVQYYLPSRFVEGYGPNTEAFSKIIDGGTTLILTVDNGVAGHEAITFAQNAGVDVIVTDHHELPEDLPSAYAIIHPKHPEGEYPFGDLAGVGVAMKVATALIGELPVEVLDLAAIGTVADLVSLTNENRAIVFFGLKMLQQTQRMGLLQLLNIIGISPNEINEDTIGFQIAPRLNAVGRLGEASPCVELLSTHDFEKATELAGFVDDKNIERKKIVEQMTRKIKEQLTTKEGTEEVIVLADESWHQGVLGIVASRIIEYTNKPTLLFTIDQESGIAKGSARSVEGFNLYEAFSEIENLFIQFGGHYMAAGMSAEVKHLTEIQNQLTKIWTEIDQVQATQFIDAFISLDNISTETIKDLDKLRPFGTDNNKPMIATKNVTVLQKRKIGKENNHLKLLVGQDDHQLDIISFQNGHIDDVLFEQQQVTVAGSLEINEWNGHSKPQMLMEDMDIPGPLLIDNRLSNLTIKAFNYENIEYVFYQQKTYDSAIKYIPKNSTGTLLSSEADALDYEAKQNFIIVDCPKSIEQFQNTLQQNAHFNIRCYFYKENHLFLDGLPNREDFSKAYKFMIKHKNINLKKHGHILSQKLNIHPNKILLIVQVFLEAKFVIIDNGVLNVDNNPEKINIQNTKAFKQAVNQMKAEQLFIYSSFKEIIDTTIE